MAATFSQQQSAKAGGWDAGCMQPRKVSEVRRQKGCLEKRYVGNSACLPQPLYHGADWRNQKSRARWRIAYRFVLWGLSTTRITTRSPLFAPLIPCFASRLALYCALLRLLGLRLCQRASCNLPLGGYWGVLRSV